METMYAFFYWPGNLPLLIGQMKINSDGIAMAPEIILKRSGGIPSGPAHFDPSMPRRSLVIVETSANGSCEILTRRVGEKLSWN